MSLIASRTLRVITGIALAPALCVPALAGQSDYFLKLGGVNGESQDDKHKNQIEILSYSWGETHAAAAKVSKVDAISIKQSVQTDDVGEQRDYAKEPARARANDRLRSAGPVTRTEPVVACLSRPVTSLAMARPRKYRSLASIMRSNLRAIPRLVRRVESVCTSRSS